MIKFRVFDKRYNTYLSPVKVGNMLWDALNSKDYILEQFTGIKCNWGYDVYENDILTDDYEKYVVEWDEKELQWVMQSDNAVLPLIDLKLDNEFRVIGNINENK